MTIIDENLGNDFRIGDTLSKSFKVLFRRFFPLLTLVLIFQVPIIIWMSTSGMYLTGLENPELLFEDHGSQILWMLVPSIILSLASSAAVTYGVFLELTGRSIRIGECLSKSISVLIPVVLAGINSYIFILTGLFFVIIPGLIVVLHLFVVIPVVVVENPGVFKSLGRSAELTKGNRWAILGLFIIMIIIGVGLGFLSQEISLIFIGMGMTIVGVLVDSVIQAISTLIYLIIGAVTYNNLRQSKEGVSSGEIASVFD
ncbi:hypothetical protein [Kiloniella antarctica]|uniref:DUF7847 domain-containing protein n=1 Tax=Kiloniella antarctica TaxID=1550907 RepID=A0ABW5BKA7_9PROT